MMDSPQIKDSVVINLRATSRQLERIDLAAKRQGRSRSDFMLGAACREAEEVLLDQAFFSVSEDTFKKLQTLLDQPPPPTKAFRRLLQTKAPWDDNAA